MIRVENEEPCPAHLSLKGNRQITHKKQQQNLCFYRHNSLKCNKKGTISNLPKDNSYLFSRFVANIPQVCCKYYTDEKEEGAKNRHPVLVLVFVNVLFQFFLFPYCPQLSLVSHRGVWLLLAVHT